MEKTDNKVEYGLRNAHYAIVTVDEATNAVTFGSHVIFPGKSGWS